MGKDICLDIPWIRFGYVREQEGLKSLVNIAVNTVLDQLDFFDYYLLLYLSGIIVLLTGKVRPNLAHSVLKRW